MSDGRGITGLFAYCSGTNSCKIALFSRKTIYPLSEIHWIGRRASTVYFLWSVLKVHCHFIYFSLLHVYMQCIINIIALNVTTD